MTALYMVTGVIAYLWIGILRAKIARKVWGSYNPPSFSKDRVKAPFLMRFLFPSYCYWAWDDPWVHDLMKSNDKKEGVYLAVNALFWVVPMTWSILWLAARYAWFAATRPIILLNWLTDQAISRAGTFAPPKTRVDFPKVESKQDELNRLRAEFATHESRGVELQSRIHELEAELEIGNGSVHRVPATIPGESS